MDKKLEDMYSAAQAYKQKETTGSRMDSFAKGPSSEAEATATDQKILESGANGGQDTKTMNANQWARYNGSIGKAMKNTFAADQWLYYFGMQDASNAIMAARESDKGAFKQKTPTEDTKTDSGANTDTGTNTAI